jgi:hypothetical protein
MLVNPNNHLIPFYISDFRAKQQSCLPLPSASLVSCGKFRNKYRLYPQNTLYPSPK